LQQQSPLGLGPAQTEFPPRDNGDGFKPGDCSGNKNSNQAKLLDQIQFLSAVANFANYLNFFKVL